MRDQLQFALGSAYTIERELGGGGMARVFVAHETTLQRQVVVKVLSLDPAALVSVERFRREIAASLAYLQEGMVDLLAANLTGEGGPRATDPRATLALWRRSAARGEDVTAATAHELARSLGAARVILGSVVKSGSSIIITAELIGPNANRRAHLRVAGAPDSLPQLVDQLTAQILAGQSDATARVSTALAHVPLPALRAYMDGQAAFRRARYAEATTHYRRALQIDSTFALAVLSGTLSEYWQGGVADFRVPLARLWKSRDELSMRDRAMTEALAIRFLSRLRVPGYDGPRGARAIMLASDSAIRVAPDNPDVWHEVADDWFHAGPLTFPAVEARRRAVAAFERVIQLDSSYASAYEHLVDAAVLDGDTARARWAATKYLALDSLADRADYIRWRLAHAVADSAGIRANRARIAQMTFNNVLRIAGIAMVEGIDAGDATAAVARMAQVAERRSQRRAAAAMEYLVLSNQGRLTAAREQVRVKPDQGPTAQDLLPDLSDLYESMYGDLELGEGERAARRAEKWLSAHDRPQDQVDRYEAACVLAEWYLSRGDFAPATNARAIMRTTVDAADSVGAARNTSTRESLCLSSTDTWAAVLRNEPNARRKLEHLDSLVVEAREIGELETPLIVARLWERLGEPARAVDAIRHRFYHYRNSAAAAAWIAREEGRLATLAGDREGAIRAYRRFLGMRPDPEERFRPEVERVKNEVDRLVRAGTGR